MSDRLQSANTAKRLHWLTVALLLAQYLTGWLLLMFLGARRGADDVSYLARHRHAGTHRSAVGMAACASGGTGEFTCRLAAADLGGPISFFISFSLPMLASKSETSPTAFDGWHQAMEWTLLVFISISCCCRTGPKVSFYVTASRSRCVPA